MVQTIWKLQILSGFQMAKTKMDHLDQPFKNRTWNQMSIAIRKLHTYVSGIWMVPVFE